MTHRILMIEADQDALARYTSTLKQAGYALDKAVTALEGLQKVYQAKPDLILLDTTLPDLNGWETCPRLRALTNVPILMFSASSSPQKIVKGLSLGADGYLIKPVSGAELLVRVRAIIRRAYYYNPTPPETRLRYKDLEVDVEKHEVRIGTEEVKLSPLEFKLLLHLLRHKGQTLPFTDLITRVWGPEYDQEWYYVRQYISYLRHKIEPDPANPTYIHNVRGVGYHFGSLTH